MRKPASPKHPRADSGFMLIEIMISSLILVIGLLSLLSLYTHAVATVSFSEDDLLAKQKAREALESLFTARNTSQISFSSIDSPESGGIFLSGPQPLRLPGPFPKSRALSHIGLPVAADSRQPAHEPPLCFPLWRAGDCMR